MMTGDWGRLTDHIKCIQNELITKDAIIKMLINDRNNMNIIKDRDSTLIRMNLI